MSITTYSELKTAISSWTHRADLANYLDDIVTLGEARIMRDVRTSDMETALTGTVSSGSLALPTGYLDLKFAYVSQSTVTKLIKKSASWVYEKYPIRSGGEIPKFIAREGSNFIFGPYASDVTLGGVYYKNLGPLSSSNHVLFTNNPDLYLFACLAETEPFLKNDPRIALWESKYQKIKDQVNGQRFNEDAGSDMQVTPG
jgi:hypothetical protein